MPSTYMRNESLPQNQEKEKVTYSLGLTHRGYFLIKRTERSLSNEDLTDLTQHEKMVVAGLRNKLTTPANEDLIEFTEEERKKLAGLRAESTAVSDEDLTEEEKKILADLIEVQAREEDIVKRRDKAMEEERKEHYYNTTTYGEHKKL